MPDSDKDKLSAIANEAVDSVVDMVMQGIKSGQVFVLSAKEAPQKAQKIEKMKQYHTITRMIVKAQTTDEIPENAPADVTEAIKRAQAQKARTRALIRQEQERKQEILSTIQSRREAEQKQLEQWEQARVMRMEELRKFKEDQMAKKHIEWRERRLEAKRKQQDLDAAATNVVRAHKREVPIHVAMEQQYKEKMVYPEMEKYKQAVEERKADRMVPFGDSLKDHETSYLQSQARRIQSAAQNNSEMVMARGQETSFSVNSTALANVLADDLRARTEKQKKKEEAAARIKEARKLGTNYNREHMPVINTQAREELEQRINYSKQKQEEVNEKKNLRYSEEFKSQANSYLHEAYVNPIRESPFKTKPQRPSSGKDRKKIDYLTEMRSNRVRRGDVGETSGAASPRTPRVDVPSGARSPTGGPSVRDGPHPNFEAQQANRQVESIQKKAAAREKELARRSADMDPLEAAVHEANVDLLYRDAIQKQLEVLKQ